ncbi:hypothetical protein MN0502_10780 [Arthrobacter sp. MN05-02]|nr:hypothetical protein MN0502_10780 [Arthrobacter sp. MN05-02]
MCESATTTSCHPADSFTMAEVSHSTQTPAQDPPLLIVIAKSLEDLMLCSSGPVACGAPGSYLLSLEEALSDYDTFKNDARWSPSYFPVFADGGGDFYVLGFAHETEPPI